jgi:hypothetical protein
MQSNSFLALAQALTLALVIGASALSTPALAVTCEQQHAIYTEVDGATELRFRPSDNGAMSQPFAMTLRVDDNVSLQGGIIWSQGFSQPNGFFEGTCVAGTESNSHCEYWDGIVYTIDNAGGVGLIDAADAPAAAQVLLPGLARSLHYSDVREVAEMGPGWDSFALSDCAR